MQTQQATGWHLQVSDSHILRLFNVDSVHWIYKLTYMDENKLLEVKTKIEQLLTEYQAALVPVTLISGDRVMSRVDIVSTDALKKTDNKA